MTYRIGLYLSFFVLSQVMASDSDPEEGFFHFSSQCDSEEDSSKELLRKAGVHIVTDSEEDSSIELLRNALVTKGRLTPSTMNEPFKVDPCDEESMASEQRETGAWTKKEYDEIIDELLDDSTPFYSDYTPVAKIPFKIPEPAKLSISSEPKTGSQSARAPKSVYSPRRERLTRSSGGRVLQRKKSVPIDIYKKESPRDKSTRSFSPRWLSNRKLSKGSGNK